MSVIDWCVCVCSGGGGNLLGDVSHMTIPQLEEWGVGLNVGIAWEEALHGALMPITPQASMGSLADGEWVESAFMWVGFTYELCHFKVVKSSF